MFDLVIKSVRCIFFHQPYVCYICYEIADNDLVTFFNQRRVLGP